MMNYVIAVGPLPPPLNGASVSFAAVVRHLREVGISTTVIDISPDRVRDDDGVASAIVRLRQYLPHISRFIRAVRTAPSPPSVYISAAASWGGIGRDAAFTMIARYLGAASITLHFQGGDLADFMAAKPSWFRGLCARLYRQTNHLIVLSDSLRTMFSWAPDLEGRIRVIPNAALDLTRATDELNHESFPKAPGILRIAYLSNLIESKGWLALLRAAVPIGELCADHGLKLRVEFAGQFQTSADDREVRSVKHARDLFQAEARRCEAASVSIEYLGVLGTGEKYSLLADADVFVLATTYYREAMPLSIIEAMAHAAVPICTEHRAIPDVVRDGVDGLLIPDASPRDIVRAVHELLADTARARRIANSAAVRARSEFGEERHTSQIAALLAP